ncbi:MAG: preprotein translocase subunit SecE [Minisyncoccota bacterium]
MRKMVKFLREARTELLLVNWPTRKQILHYTTLVVVISLSVAFFLGSLDYLFSSAVERLLIK